MTVSVAQMLVNIGYAVDDPNSQRFTNLQLLTYINEAQQDIARRGEVLEWIQQIPVQSANRDYYAPVDTVRVYKVEFVPPRSNQVWVLEYRGLVEMDSIWGVNQNVMSSFPALWTAYGLPPQTLIRLYPVPGTGGTITIYYYRLPHTVGLSDNIDLPSGWEDLVRDYAEFLCKRADHDPDWSTAKTQYENKLANMIDKTRVIADAPGNISSGFNPYPWYTYGEIM